MRLFYNFWTLCTFRSISSSNGYSNWKKAFIQTYAHSIIDCKMSIWQYVVIEPIKMHLLKIHFMTELLKKCNLFLQKNIELYEGESGGLVFQLAHPGRETLIFCADNDNICEKWMAAINEAVKIDNNQGEWRLTTPFYLNSCWFFYIYLVIQNDSPNCFPVLSQKNCQF